MLEINEKQYEEKNKRMCSMCREVKDESDFYYKEKRHQYNSYCKDCERIYQRDYKRAYREMHPEYVEKNRENMRNLMRKRK